MELGRWGNGVRNFVKEYVAYIRDYIYFFTRNGKRGVGWGGLVKGSTYYTERKNPRNGGIFLNKESI